MNLEAYRGEPDGPWAAFAPTDEAPWDLRRVVHLHGRSGFAATWGEIRRDLKDGPGASVRRILDGSARQAGVPEGFDAISRQLAEQTARSTPVGVPDLRPWWAFRMVCGPDPLGERLTLFWHDHFATSIDKVRDAGLMLRQNETFRHLARAPLGELLRAMSRDPALLVWLDAPANRKGAPNENLARELMELFTLGVGRYSESDVKQAARALTGRTVRSGSFAEDPAEHDDGEKTILGRAGRLGGDDLIALLLEHPATSTRLADRLCALFFGEGVVDRAARDALAADLREHDLDVGRAVAVILGSRLFSEANLGSRVRGPIEYVVGAARALELFDPPPRTLLLAERAAAMGQDLFRPPNVGGWPGGRDWISHQGVIARANFASALVSGELSGDGRPADIAGLAARRGTAAAEAPRRSSTSPAR